MADKQKPVFRVVGGIDLSGPEYQKLVNYRVWDEERKEVGIAWLRVRRNLDLLDPVRQWYEPLEMEERSQYDTYAEFALEKFRKRFGFTILKCEEAARRLREEKFAEELRRLLAKEFLDLDLARRE